MVVHIRENTKQTRNANPFKMAAEYVRSSHIDPIGDQKDVQYLSIHSDISIIFWMNRDLKLRICASTAMF